MSEDLAKRLASHKRWEWIPGMQARDKSQRAHRVLAISGTEGDLTLYVRGGPFRVHARQWDLTPNLSDPATVGCLWHMLVMAMRTREFWGYPEMEPSGVLLHTCKIGKDSEWYEDINDGKALAKALLAVWDHEPKDK